jgi:ribosomal protein S18 acetylase RimI-like enzyme
MFETNLEPATPQDDRILRQIFAETHATEFGALEEAVRTVITALQFDAQRSQYRQAYPDSVDRLVLVDGEVAGRCWTDPGAGDLRLLDLAIRPAFQRRGVASAVLRHLLIEADRVGAGVTLSVWHDNAAARSLYAGLGFVEHGPPHNGYLGLRARIRLGVV